MSFFIPSLLCVFVYGALMGSFMNVLILRIPQNIDWVFVPSHCQTCKKNLKAWMNIPIISSLVLKFKCWYCKEKISYQYIIIECIVALKTVWVFYFFNTSNNIDKNSIVNFLLYDAILNIFITHFVIDLRHKILPDILNIFLTLLVIFKIYWEELNILNSIVGMIVGFGGTFLITYLFYLIKGKIGLGGGDIKLFGIVGLALGLQGLILNLLLSSVMGLLISLVLMAMGKLKPNDPFPFGPCILAVFAYQLFS